MGASALKGPCSVIQAAETTWVKMSCEKCNVKFHLLKRKKICCDCSHTFCVSCVTRIRGTEKRHRCSRCQVFATIPLDRSAVLQLRVKDLRWYLDTNSISSQGCREKEELVDLVMHYSALRNASATYPQNYERHTEILESVSCDSEVESTENSPIPVRETASNISRGVFENARDTTSLLSESDTAEGTNSPVYRIEEREEDDFTLVDVAEVNESVPPSDVNQESEEKEETSQNDNSSDPVFIASAQKIEDITSLEQISLLSVMQLKLILTRNFIGYKGCCEKQELQEKVQWLWKQRQESKNNEMSDDNLCKICMEDPIDAVLLECGHMVTCTNCGKRLAECPICRQYVTRVVHIFKA